MDAHRVGRNDPCPCGSGRKFKQCCLRAQRFSGAVGRPALLGDGASLQQPPRRTSEPPPKPKVRVGVDYAFSDGFGTGQVSYSFERSQLFCLTDGRVLDAEHLSVGMRFHLEGGMVATVTKVEPPKIWHPPPPQRDAYGNSLKHVVGTVKYSGHYPVMEFSLGEEQIKITPGHRFYSVSRRGWVDAGSLRPGEYLQNRQGQVVPVRQVTAPRFERIELYNVEVEDYHTYFVGKTQVWSHNGLESGGCGIPKPASTPVGSKRAPLGSVEPNPPTAINGRSYGGHAIDQMQARGVPPSVVENTIQHGAVSPDPIPGRLRHLIRSTT
jgi:hypothetical protein